MPNPDRARSLNRADSRRRYSPDAYLRSAFLPTDYSGDVGTELRLIRDCRMTCRRSRRTRGFRRRLCAFGLANGQGQRRSPQSSTGGEKGHGKDRRSCLPGDRAGKSHGQARALVGYKCSVLRGPPGSPADGRAAAASVTTLAVVAAAGCLPQAPAEDHRPFQRELDPRPSMLPILPHPEHQQ